MLAARMHMDLGIRPMTQQAQWHNYTSGFARGGSVI